jgi:hypothetical protein
MYESVYEVSAYMIYMEVNNVKKEYLLSLIV